MCRAILLKVNGDRGQGMGTELSVLSEKLKPKHVKVSEEERERKRKHEVVANRLRVKAFQKVGCDCNTFISQSIQFSVGT
jgi:ABC-type phosphonate transport system ATPase subunit